MNAASLDQNDPPTELVDFVNDRLPQLSQLSPGAKETTVAYLLQQFESNPTLINGNTLWYFVSGKVGLEHIRALLSVYPAHLLQYSLWEKPRTRGFRPSPPLLQACRKSEDDVILLLATEMQKHRHENKAHVTSICIQAVEVAMQRQNVSTEMLGILISYWPQAAASPIVIGKSLAKLPRDFSEFVIASIPNQVSTIRIQQPCSDNSLLELHQAKTICSLLPRSKEISIRWKWKPESFIFFLESLPKSRSIETIADLTVPSLHSQDLTLEHILGVFWKTVVHNPQLKIHTLYARNACSNVILSWMKLLESFPTKNIELQCATKRSVWLNYVHNDIIYNGDSQSLQLRDWNFTDAAGDDFFRQASSCLNLLDLSLHGIYAQEAVQPLAEFFRSSPRLQTLYIRQLSNSVSLLPIYETLKTTRNASLFSFVVDWKGCSTYREIKVCLEMLNEFNTTLQRCPAEIDPAIEYLLGLNRLGRLTARTASPRKIVDLVVRAWKDRYFPFCPNPHARSFLRGMYSSNPEEFRFSIVFGLLLEAPGVWSNCSI